MTPEARIKDAIAWVIRHPETEPLSELAYSILVQRGAEAIQAAVAEERAANCKAMCEGCASGWMLEDKDGDLLHILPVSLRAPWEYGTGSRIGCDAAAIRARGAQ